ncbi:hypothetical protein N431DRAFT_77781 [Stipitochalara longipes BDJ]|nr:hypothetical protein N431DRAFT_77781 [Stipitochalara longipes BDJ]
MHPAKLFSILRTKIRTSSQENNTLPSYDEASKTQQASKDFKRMASKAPQWRWSTNESREWLKAVCVVYFNFSLEEAEATAKKFEGFGATIYLKSIDSWIMLLGENGRGLYGMLVGLRRERGAVPRTVEIGYRH